MLRIQSRNVFIDDTAIATTAVTVAVAVVAVVVAGDCVALRKRVSTHNSTAITAAVGGC